MADTARNPDTAAIWADIEVRIDRAFTTFWRNLEERLQLQAQQANEHSPPPTQ
ncbi:Hypothetical predicted protein, partial [Pelobates cultripes]